MKKYISHKIVDAAKIVRFESNSEQTALFIELEGGAKHAYANALFARGGPSDEDMGYIVVYADGYKSWTPSDPFEAGYTELGSALTFSEALESLKMGLSVSRAGWNGNDMFVFLVKGSEFEVNREPLLSVLGEGTRVSYRPHIDIRTADGSISVWQPSMGDVMANDWSVVR